LLRVGREEGADLGEEEGEVVLDRAPHTIIFDQRVSVHEHMAEIDDLARLGDLLA
jgi:hypothetical protein